jgi:predicted GNAT family acetyltransferase
MTILDNKDELRFETLIEGEHAYLEYRWNNNELVLIHTFVLESLRGRRIADKLAAFVLEYAKAENMPPSRDLLLLYQNVCEATYSI